ncbi:hypothetical protein SBOR_7793 [Sclerotinia borealis F-4128]|uniref:Shelterin complex subunit TPP1/Est3 domain-containing protein n=1 Tax=Sclerotinia borealis (strain F-4128) TaxID=1432307 RepID=W9C7N1_SCLBF|nr:hypothetical protein SBOR_7793 [Sclerotinia borealis F-4128]
MTLLRGWLAQNIEQSLAEALIWLKSTQVVNQNVDKSHSQFSYEQEKLTIKLQKPGLIQIIGSTKVRNSLQFMTVSDGTTEIAAIFQQDFLKSFLEKNKRALEGLIGEVLAAGECQLQISGSARALEFGGTTASTLLTMKELLNPNDCDNDFHSNLEPRSPHFSPPLYSSKFATQISESRKEKNVISGVQVPDVLRVIQRNQEQAIPYTSTRPQLNEPGPSLDSANITSVAQPVSPKSRSAATNSERDDVGNTTDAHIPRLSPKRSMNKQEIGSDSIRGNNKSSASNARLMVNDSATANRRKVYQIEETHSFQDNSTLISRSYERISREQMNILNREESWYSSSENHDSIPLTILQAQLALHEKRLVAQTSAYRKNMIQSTEDLTLDQDRDTAEAEDSEDGDDSHHENDVLKGSYKDAEEVEYTYELSQSQIIHDHDEGHQSDSATSDASGISWSRTPEADPRLRQVAEENDVSDQTLDKGHLQPIDNAIIKKGVDMPSQNESNEPTLEAFRKRMVNSPPPSPAVAQSARTSAINIRVPTESTWNPASSPSDDEEMDLEVPHVLGDQIQSSNLHANELQHMSQHSLPGTAGHMCVVQVKKTPNQRNHPNKDLSSDIIIPGTYTSSQNEPDEDNFYIPKSGVFSLPRPPKSPSPTTEAFNETLQNKHEQHNLKLQHLCDQHISSWSNSNMIRQIIAHPYSPLQIPNLDGATSDVVPPSTDRSSSMNYSPSSRKSPDRNYNGGRSAKRRRITDPVALGFSQEETSYRDRTGLARAIRRRVLQSLPPSEDSRMAEDDIEKDLQSLASPKDSRTVEDSIEKDLPSTVISEKFSAYNNRPLDHLTSPLMTANDDDTSRKSILPDETQSSSRQVHQSEQKPISLFEEYRKTYSRYAGSKKQFIQALVYLEWLGTIRQPHEALWDDFVRCFAQEYSNHLRTGATKMTGILFHKESDIDVEFFHPTPIGRITTQESLKAALSPESPDYDLIEDIRRKYKGAARPALQQSSVPSSDKSEPAKQPFSEQMAIADTNDTLVPGVSKQLDIAVPQRPFETTNQTPLFSNTDFTPRRQEKGLTVPRTETSMSRSKAPKMLETVAASTSALKEPEKVAPRRFFETSSQLQLSSDLGSLPRDSLPSTQKLASPMNSPRTPNGQSIQSKAIELAPPIWKEASFIMSEKMSSTERRPQDRSSKPSLERSIHPLSSHSKSMAALNKPEKVTDWLKNQEQPMNIEKPPKLTSTTQAFKGKWEFGKYLAQKRRESAHRPPRLTPRTSFSLKSRSSSGSNGSPM